MAERRVFALEEVVDLLDYMRRPINSTERQDRQGDVPYYGATGQAGWINEALFNETLVLLGEDAIDFVNPDARKAYLVRGPSWVNNHAHVLRARESVVLPEFLVCALNEVDYSEHVSFGTRSKLTQASMRRIRLAIPSIAVQRRIVDLVGALDAHVAALRLERAAIEALWTVIVASLDNETALVPLDTLLEGIEAGKSPSGEERLPGPGERAVLKVSAIEQKRFNEEAVKTVAASVVLPESSLVRLGDVLMVRANGVLSRVGQVCQVSRRPDSHLYLCDKTLRLLARQDLLRPNYLRHVLASSKSREQIEALTTGSHMRNITQQAIRKVEIPLPSLLRQRDLAETLDSCLAQSEALKVERRSLTDLRTRLLSGLLTTEIEIPDTYDALLEAV